MVLGKRINKKNFFKMQQLSFESVPEISLPPCILCSYVQLCCIAAPTLGLISSGMALISRAVKINAQTREIMGS